MPSNAYDDEGSSLFCFHKFSFIAIAIALTPHSLVRHRHSSPPLLPVPPCPSSPPSGEERGKEGGLGYYIIVAGGVLIVYVTGLCVGGGVSGKQLALECSVFSPNGTVWWRIQGSWFAAVSCF